MMSSCDNSTQKQQHRFKFCSAWRLMFRDFGTTLLNFSCANSVSLSGMQTWRMHRNPKNWANQCDLWISGFLSSNLKDIPAFMTHATCWIFPLYQWSFPSHCHIVPKPWPFFQHLHIRYSVIPTASWIFPYSPSLQLHLIHTTYYNLYIHVHLVGSHNFISHSLAQQIKRI